MTTRRACAVHDELSGAAAELGYRWLRRLLSRSLSAVAVMACVVVSSMVLARASRRGRLPRWAWTRRLRVQDTTPGADFTYTLTARCSGLTEACMSPVVTDVIPPEIEVTALPQIDHRARRSPSTRRAGL